MNITLAQLATLTEGTLATGDPDRVITGFSTISEAQPGDVTFIGNPRYLAKLKKSGASAVLAPLGFKEAPGKMAVIEVENPSHAFSSIIARFGPQPRPFQPGVHPDAMVSESARFDRSKVFVGVGAIIDDDVIIGDGSSIHPGAYIGRGVRIGEQSVIHANAVIKQRCVIGNRVTLHSCSVIGTDGFGYQLQDALQVKVEQVGIVQIDDDVEIGSCTTIDRARFGRTWIGAGTKIDNQVQIAHNVIIGPHSIICAHVGVSGSVRTGHHVIMAGQVGVSGHVEIGDNVVFLARSGVTKDTSEPGHYTGFPAKPLMEGRRLLAAPGMVPGLIKRIRALEERLADLEAKMP